MMRLAFLLGALCANLASSAVMSHGQVALTLAQHLRAEPKKEEKGAEPAKKEGAAPKKVDLMKPMTPKAAEQGFEGKQVQHKDGETASADWHNEYGNDKPAEAPPPPPKKSGSMRCNVVSATVLLASAALWFGQ